MLEQTYVEYSSLVFWIAQDLKTSQFPLARRRQEDGINVNVSVC